MSKAGGQGEAPVVQPTTVAAAGLASTTAAAVTSSVGVGGTILGAALTTMIITGGSAMIKVGMERATGTIRKTTKPVRKKAVAEDTEQPPPPPYPPDRGGDHPPERPDLRNNLMGRLRAGISKFPRLPERRRRSVIVGTAIASLVAFFVAMAAVTGVELAVGKTLSCWVWGNCPVATTASGEALNTRPSIFGGGQSSQAAPGGVPLDQQGIPQEGLPEAEEPAGGQQLPQDTPSQELPQEAPQEQPATPAPDQQGSPQELPQE